MKILSDLNTKLCGNLDEFLLQGQITCKQTDIRARAIAAIGQIALEQDELQPSQHEIALIFNEVFSDMILSIYLTACALNKPSQNVLRRALELGIAIVYLWDLPHMFWGWKVYDSDLNFNDMVDHLTKEGYKSFLKSLNPQYQNEDLFDYKEARRLYRTMSNTIHGKIQTHEACLPGRFSYNLDECHQNIVLVDRVQVILLNLFKKRFFNYYAEMEKRIPSINPLI